MLSKRAPLRAGGGCDASCGGQTGLGERPSDQKGRGWGSHLLEKRFGAQRAHAWQRVRKAGHGIEQLQRKTKSATASNR